MQFKKIVVVGDTLVGKTALVSVFTTGEFPLEVDAPDDDIIHQFQIDEPTPTTVGVLDVTVGGGVNPRFRALSYPLTDAFLLCFSIADANSLESVHLQWVPELRHHCGDVPIVLVGCKKDIREDPDKAALLAHDGRSPVSSKQGAAIALRIGAFKYCECAAINGHGVKEVFQNAVEAATFPSTGWYRWSKIERQKHALCNLL
ncbi:cell division cycle 42-like protein [Zopfochytrium polystomum]|nr:cell division cycle 42-like protein [Zopfochytrium polystomum]